MKLLDPRRLKEIAESQRESFANANPYPHVVIDDFLPERVAEDVLAEFPLVEEHWKYYSHYNERKLALTDLDKMPPSTRALSQELISPDFRNFITTLSGIEQLISDPTLEGAGMHVTRPGGYLNVHTDFLTHTKNRSWRRQINLLIYLNKDWQHEWQGDLEIWNRDLSECVASVAPSC